MTPAPGHIVRTRSRQYLVEDVVAPPSPGDDTLVRLSCLDDDAQGEPLEVLWEREIDARVINATDWSKVNERGFDPPHVFAAYLHTLRWNAVSSANARVLQAPYRAGIEVKAFQLEPLRKALLLPRVNLFVADDVGLGKTIEAGLITRELILRQKVRRIVVACPPSVVLQWRDEMEQRFGLRFVVFDRDYVLQKRRERGYGVNAWATHTRFIISHALLRDEAYAGPLRDWLAQDQEPGQPRGTLLILDEAHNAAPASGAKYAIDSRFTRTVREIAPLFEHRLFLSATPHNGHTNSFSALLEILDPQRFCRGVKAVPRNLEAVMVRRLKDDLREIGEDFPKRIPEQVDIAGLPEDAPELALAALLNEYRELRETKVKDASKSVRSAAAIVLTGLQKRLLSSIEAFATTLRAHRRGIERARKKGKGDAAKLASLSSFDRQLTLRDAPGADDERGDLSEDEVRAEDEDDFSTVSEVAVALADLEARETELLEQMTEIAERARSLPDARVRYLVNWIRTRCLQSDGCTWQIPQSHDETGRVLIFTEYADTKRYLDEQLRAALAHTDRADDRVAVFHGGMNDEAREEVKRAFNASLAAHPLRILIATDAAREGVNLQNHCADLFHFDVPWNPSRMEQRNGRIDRKLQRAKEVRCHYFVYAQRPEDKVLETLVKKTKNIQLELGSLAPVLESRLGRLLESGIWRGDASRLATSIEREDVEKDRRLAVDEELEGAIRARRGLLEQQINGLRDMMSVAKDTLAFDEVPFRAALDASLGLLGAKPLRPVADANDVWMLPEDDPRLRTDPTWSETLDTLRVPRRRDVPVWEWRKSSPIRPVVFRDVGSLDDAHVHLHLEHRLVQRLLGRFLAQGFVHDDLARACIAFSDDPIPRVVLLGRLALYGDRAARLHDEIIAVAARWHDPDTRTAPLKPYADEARARALDLVENALTDGRAASAGAIRKIASSVARDVSELVAPLHAAGEQRAARVQDQLFTRGEKEAKDIREILETQRKRIEERLADSQTTQLSLGFDEGERRQLELDQRHWRKRVTEIEREIEAEPARIRASYATRAKRIDPIGIVYLWPTTG